jgi:hypothetical protein
MNKHLFMTGFLALTLGFNACDCANGSQNNPSPTDASPESIDWNQLFDSGVNDPGPGDGDAGSTIDGGVVTVAVVDSGGLDDVCVAISVTADNVVLPVDIIWVIDSSPSMGDSILLIEENLNAFTADIGSSGLDYHVVVVGSEEDGYDPAVQHSYLGICIPEPLSATAGCPDTDSDTYRHIREGVHSDDSIHKLINHYTDYQDFLREGAIVHFVAVTDDDTGWNSDDEDFNNFIAGATNPGFPNGFTFHSIVDLVGYILGCGLDEPCSCGEERGQEYINLSEATGGIVQSVCQEDWTPVFDALKENVIEGALLPCEFALPSFENGLQIDPDETNVVLISTEDGTRTTLPNVSGPNACNEHQAWFFNRPVNPSIAVLCSEACGLVNTTIELEFGCEIVKYPNQ